MHNLKQHVTAHVTNTLPTRYQTLYLDINPKVLFYDTLPHVTTIF